MRRTLFGKLGDFVLGKGFYIVLFLCVAAIGISGYYFVDALQAPPAADPAPVTGNQSITLPDLPPAPQEQPEEEPPREEDPPAQTAPPSSAPEKVPALPSATTQDSPTAQAVTSRPAVPEEPVAYVRPVAGEVLRPFDVESLSYDPTMGDWRTHAGVDLAADGGTPVACMAPGTVSRVEEDPLMGTTVWVEHADRLVSIYANLAREVEVSAGQQLGAGEMLGRVGSTAHAESAQSPHLHLAVEQDGQPVDPMAYLPRP